MTTNRRLWPLLLVLLLALGLSACGDDDDDADTASEDTTEDTAGGDAEGADVVTIDMVDYGFDVSGALAAGGSLHLVNSGAELHMMGVGKLKEGATLEELVDALEGADPNAEEDPTAEFIEEEPEIGWPGGFVSPGNEVTFSAANLEPGTYAMLCFIPTEGDGAPHFAKGMVNQLEVVEGDVEAAEADATYTITTGEPIEGPATLEAGEHTIEITGDRIQTHEPQLVRAESPDQTPDEINELINERFGAYESEEGPAKGLGEQLGDLISFAGFDFGDVVGGVTFTFDFEPGVYYLAAPDTDEEDSEGKVPDELIKITVE